MMRKFIFAAGLLILALKPAAAVELERIAATGDLDDQTIVRLIIAAGYQCDPLDQIGYGNAGGGGSQVYVVSCNNWRSTFYVADFRGTGEWAVCGSANLPCLETAIFGRR